MDDFKLNQMTQEGDLVQLVSPTNKVLLFQLKAGEQLHTHRGVVKTDDLINIPWGSQVFSHQGSPFFLIQPSLSDILRETKRNTQIIYPKDIGFILITMGIRPGSLVLEAGTGSGALTTALAWAVGPQGHVFSYEARADIQNLARKNLQKLGLLERVTLKNRNIAEGFDEKGVDSLFLDLPDPYEYLPQVRAALKSGGAFGSILPTTNQVSRLLSVFHANGFSFIDVCEILLRYYKANADRLRPADRMVAHTGFLIFARSILPAQNQITDKSIQPDQP
ncbi:MAG: tRNA (adenine-N1)-methyltransferase [Anaerolineales bacterium]|nr:tRNA (adenine-N1)-methyltransferase [Anaerolineales bacterium]